MKQKLFLIVMTGAFASFLFLKGNFSQAQRPDIPQGSVSPDSGTGGSGDRRRFQPRTMDKPEIRPDLVGEGFFAIGPDGKIVNKSWDEALAESDCPIDTKIEGMGGRPLICCPEGQNHAAIKAKKLTCMQNGKQPREMRDEEIENMVLSDGRPLREQDCKPMTCDEDCDNQGSPFPRDGRLDTDAGSLGGGGAMTSPEDAQRQRREFAMDSTDDADKDAKADIDDQKAINDNQKEIDEKQKEIDRQQRELWGGKDQAPIKVSDKVPEQHKALQDAKKELKGLGSEGKGSAGAAARAKVDGAQKAYDKALKDYQAKKDHIGGWIDHLQGRINEHQAAIDAARQRIDDRHKRPRDDMGGGNPTKVREEFCREHPEACPSKEEQVGRPQDPDVGGGLPIDDDPGSSEFVCIDEGMGGGGGGRPMGEGGGLPGGGADYGESTGGSGGGEKTVVGRGGSGDCGGAGGGGKPDGAGEGDNFGVETTGGSGGGGETVVGRGGGGDCGGGPQGGGGFPGVDDPLVNPGTFWEGCPERECVNQNPNSRNAGTKLNSCPENTKWGKIQKKMSCGTPIEWYY